MNTTTSKEYIRTKSKPKSSKYHNIKVEYKGMKFDSKKELKRYQELELMENAGEISDLEFHPYPYELSPNPEIESIKYKPDYVYREKYDECLGLKNYWKIIVEDCKGFKTPVYKLKKKLMHAKYGIVIKES